MNNLSCDLNITQDVYDIKTHFVCVVTPIGGYLFILLTRKAPILWMEATGLLTYVFTQLWFVLFCKWGGLLRHRVITTTN